MKPKKTNTHMWQINVIYVDKSQYQLYGRNTTIIGYDLKNMKTGQILRIPKSTYDKMFALRLIDPIWYSNYCPIDPDFFDHVQIDESFLKEYMDGRPTWDEYFMALAHLASSRSTCDRLYVGCVLVKDNHIIATGYNGSISGHPHCDEVGHLEVEENGKIGCKRTVHAEKNAISMCTKFGISPKGATAYVTHYPCPDCMKELNQAGITEVVYGNFYQHRYENNFHEGMNLREFTGRKPEINWGN
jgi:dCMP deaminase